MKMLKFNNLGLMAGLFGLVLVLALPAAVKADDKYAACSGINDFLSYSKCVAQIDNQQTGQPTALVDASSTQDGVFSLKVGDGSGTVYTTDVTLTLTASADTAQIAVSQNSNFGFAERQSFAAKKLWRLDPNPSDTQYVFVKFLDKDGNELKVVSAAVMYVPRQVDAVAEAAAKKDYLKIYKKAINSQNSFDSAWLDIAAYDVASGTPKDIAKEKTATAKFLAVYKKNPKTTADWRLVHAMAYTPTATVTAPTTPVLTDTTATNTTTACVAQPIKQVLDVGSKGAEVKNLQTVMQCAGYLGADAKLDGIFDKNLESAVAKFQEDNKLPCANGAFCGRVGPATAKKIVEIYKAGKTEVAGIKTTDAVPAAPTKTALKLSRSLTLGSKGTDVKSLQTYLAQDSEIYPEGKITGTFDAATENAIKKFQEKYSLTCKDGTACGFVGPATIKKLQEASAQ